MIALGLWLKKKAHDWDRRALLRRPAKAVLLGVEAADLALRRGPASGLLDARERHIRRHIAGLQYDRANWTRLRELKAAKIRRKAATSRGIEARMRSMSPVDFPDGVTHDVLMTSGFADSDLESYDWRDLLELYEYFMWFGDFRVASFFRRHSILSAKLEQSRRGHILPYALNGALEDGDGDLALAWLAGKSRRTVTEEYFAEAQALAYALAGNRAKAAALWESRFTGADRRYLEFVGGRSVAMVGPAAQLDDVGPEIDSYDLIVRTNFNSASPLPALHYGGRTDISYYNHAGWVLRRDVFMKALDSLRWVNMKGRDTDRHLARERPDWDQRARVFYQAEVFFNLGSPMAIPNVLFDLIRFSPKTLTLFSADFYAGGVNYHEAYFRGRPQSQIPSLPGLSNGLRIHEAFGTFLLVRAFLRAGLLDTDRITGRVLGLSEDEYAAEIQRQFGDHTLG